MRTTPLFGLVAFAILVTALVGLLGPNQEPAPSVEAIRETVPISSTTSAAAASTVPKGAAHPVDRAPDVDELGVAAEDLEVTTTTVALPTETSAKAPSSNPGSPPTQPKAAAAPTTTAPAPEAEAGPNADFESQFASKINGFRSGDGLAELSRDGTLDSKAREWAEQMADEGGLSHSDLGSLLPPWSAAAENVGMGGSVKSVFGALAGSSGHKSNMLGDYTHFGIGVWVDSGGTIWTAHVFTH